MWRGTLRFISQVHRFSVTPHLCSFRFASNERNVTLYYIHKVRHTRSVLLTEYCAGGKIEKNEMGGACGAYGGGERGAQDFGGET